MPSETNTPSINDRLFELRWQRSEQDLLEPFRLFYGNRHDVEARLKSMLQQHWDKRPDDLKDLDLQRDIAPDWFLSEKMIGYVFYVDRFSGTLIGVLDHVDYLESLGTTYFHSMPCLKPRPGDSDGGYSVMDYRAIDPKLGTMDDFDSVSRSLRQRGMDVCVDLVLNHTVKKHDWAMRWPPSPSKKGKGQLNHFHRELDIPPVITYISVMTEISARTSDSQTSSVYNPRPSSPRKRGTRLSAISHVESLGSRVRGNDNYLGRDDSN